MTELQGPGWETEQNWVMTFLDPCRLTAVLAGMNRDKKDEKMPFWETNGFANVPLAGHGEAHSV